MALVECLCWGGVSNQCARQAGCFDVTHGQQQEIEMNQDRFAGICKQLRGKLRGRWGELTNNPLGVTAGTRDQLAGRIQERYGVSKENAARQLKDFLDRNRNWDLANR
jgi:uncharacterized protein YjbJ (UPF0337 family)